MTPLATARWQRLDGPGHDQCRLIAEPGGFMLYGHARFTESGAEAALDYVVRCDAGWATTGADIGGVMAGREVGWKITRDPGGGWRLNGRAVAGLDDCLDLDLGFTPATNLLPLRRLGLLPRGRAALAAAWFLPGAGGGRLLRLEQSYDARGAGQVAYRSDQFAARIEVHETGLPRRYGDLWDGRVDDAALG